LKANATNAQLEQFSMVSDAPLEEDLKYALIPTHSSTDSTVCASLDIGNLLMASVLPAHLTLPGMEHAANKRVVNLSPKQLVDFSIIILYSFPFLFIKSQTKGKGKEHTQITIQNKNGFYFNYLYYV